MEPYQNDYMDESSWNTVNFSLTNGLGKFVIEELKDLEPIKL